MIRFDHVALTISNLNESIKFYESIGYKLQKRFCDDEYNWATLKFGETNLELFEMKDKMLPTINHIAYSFDDKKEAIDLVIKLGYSKTDLDVFLGDLNRESFFVKDLDGNSIQLIKK